MADERGLPVAGGALTLLTEIRRHPPVCGTSSMTAASEYLGHADLGITLHTNTGFGEG